MHSKPPAATYVHVDGVELCVERAGCGLQILCLPALGHDARDFDALATQLGPGFEIIRVEWPGHGRSGADHCPASAQRYARLLMDAAPKLGLKNPIVVGNSIGGAAAILFATRHAVSALVLCNSGGLNAVGKGARIFCALFEKFFAAGERGAFWYGAVFALYYRWVLITREAAAQRSRIVASSRRLAPIFREAWASFGRPEADLRQLVTQLEVPIWVAWARRDRIIPLSRCIATIRAMKKSSLSLFQAGHAAFLEQPSRFAQEFKRFARSLEAVAADAAVCADV